MEKILTTTLPLKGKVKKRGDTMKIASIVLLALIGSLAAIEAAPPGQTSGGRTYREDGKIKRTPHQYNAQPQYYGGGIIYQQQGRPQRDSSGKIQYEQEHSSYPYHHRSVRYDLEKERIRDLDQQRNEQDRQSREDFRNRPRNY